MKKLKIKAISVNKCWQGRRFKTTEYKEYEENVLTLLPKLKIPEGELKVEITFGLSNRANDIDNGVKPFVDIMQKKYGFNDNRIYLMILKKEIVKKGKEFIKFKISKV